MIEKDVSVGTKYGEMPAFFACAEGEPMPPVIFYMDAPGFREELKMMARRIAARGYACLLPDMYYRLGTLRFDVQRREETMRAVTSAARHSLTSEKVMDDTGGMLAFLDAQGCVAPGPVGCVGYCMSGRYIMDAAAMFPSRIASAASLYGVQIVTEEKDSPHLKAAKVKGELHFTFAEHDELVPDNVIPDLTAALEKANVKHTVMTAPDTHHGFCFPERPIYNPEAAEKNWQDLFDLWGRTLR